MTQKQKELVEATMIQRILEILNDHSSANTSLQVLNLLQSLDYLNKIDTDD